MVVIVVAWFKGSAETDALFGNSQNRPGSVQDQVFIWFLCDPRVGWIHIEPVLIHLLGWARIPVQEQDTYQTRFFQKTWTWSESGPVMGVSKHPLSKSIDSTRF